MRLIAAIAAPSLALAAASLGAVDTPEIADPRPRSAVVDTTGTLAAADRAAIDSLAGRAREGGELVVVVIPTVGYAPPRLFATELFNRWQLDGRGRNRGVMLLVAVSDRKAEIVLGDGYPAGATRRSNDIMKQLVAQFRGGRPREAVVQGARNLVEGLILIREAPRAQARAPGPAPERLAAVPAAPRVTPVPRPAAPTGAGEGLLATLSENALPVSGALGSALAGGALLFRRHLRHRPRTCPSCSSSMVRLEEVEEDGRLTSAEQAEERVGSADYDVWVCSGCPQVQKLRYGALFTSYASCPRCNAKTVTRTTSTLEAATSVSEGRLQVDELCAHCSYSDRQIHRIP
ncbi:MAG TPA: TPM domain-containing protein, partial [Vicinamibacteria bacterium]